MKKTEKANLIHVILDSLEKGRKKDLKEIVNLIPFLLKKTRSHVEAVAVARVTQAVAAALTEPVGSPRYNKHLDGAYFAMQEAYPRETSRFEDPYG